MSHRAILDVLAGLGLVGSGAWGAETKQQGPAAAARVFDVEAGKIAELNMTTSAGSTVKAKLSRAAHDLQWAAHSHRHGGCTKIHSWMPE